MLLGSFYTVCSFEASDASIDARIRLNASHAIYGGHFPGNPVTPGVVEMEIVKELLEKRTGKQLALQSLSNAKFLAILNPEAHPEVDFQLSISDDGEAIKCTAVVQCEGTSFFKLQGIYRSAPGSR